MAWCSSIPLRVFQFPRVNCGKYNWWLVLIAFLFITKRIRTPKSTNVFLLIKICFICSSRSQFYFSSGNWDYPRSSGLDLILVTHANLSCLVTNDNVIAIIVIIIIMVMMIMTIAMMTMLMMMIMIITSENDTGVLYCVINNSISKARHLELERVKSNLYRRVHLAQERQNAGHIIRDNDKSHVQKLPYFSRNSLSKICF